MAKSVVLTKTAAGNFYIVEKNEAEVVICEKPFTAADFTVSFATNKIKLVPPQGHVAVMVEFHSPEDWTVGAETGYTTVLQVAEAITTLAKL